MNISTDSLVSNSDMIKNYKACRDKAQSNGKIFILKNNQPDAVLFSIDEYERLAVFIEYMESIEDDDITKIVELLLKEGNKKIFSFNPSIHNINDLPADKRS